MWAEIHKKIPQHLAGLEDMLTGNFFGLLQYGDTRLLACILEAVSFRIGNEDYGKQAFEEFLALLHSGVLRPRYNFWPHKDRRFIDLLIEFPGQDYLLGIEVKYQSGLSRNDEITPKIDTLNLEKQQRDAIEESKNQLLEYARVYGRRNSKQTAFFIIWAPIDMAVDIINGISDTPKQMNEVTRLQAETIFLGQISWQQAATQLKNACKAGWGDLNEKIRKDLIAYLEVKQLDGFICFNDASDIAMINPKEFFYFPKHKDEYR